MTDRLLSSRDVAERLQVNIRTAQRIIRSIPHVNIGTGRKNEHLRVTEEMLGEYIAERTVVPSSAPVSRGKAVAPRRISAFSNGRIPRRRSD